MTKRFGLLLIVLLVAPLLLSACASDSEKVAEDYMKAVLSGQTDTAKDLACADFQDQTERIVAAYQALTPAIDTDSIDLKFDVGKGNNQNEIIVTGSYKYGEDRENLKEYELAASIRKDADSEEMVDTRAVLMMEESDGEWCVSSNSTFGDLELSGAAPETTEPAATPSATEEVPEPAATEAAE